MATVPPDAGLPETPPAVAAGAPSRTALALFRGVGVLAVVLIVLPLGWYVAGAPFAGRRMGMGLFLVTALERLWAMYLRPGARHVGSAAGRDWTAPAVGYAYVLTMGLAIVEFLVRRRGLPGTGWFAAGTGAYAVAVALRYWAFGVLRRQWRVDVTDVAGDRRLVRTGPYRFVRHPLYLGACLEAVALPVFLGAPIAGAFGLLVFIPLEVARAYHEERFLKVVFGTAYERYAEQVPAFLPRFGASRTADQPPPPV